MSTEHLLSTFQTRYIKFQLTVEVRWSNRHFQAKSLTSKVPYRHVKFKLYIEVFSLKSREFSTKPGQLKPS